MRLFRWRVHLVCVFMNHRGVIKTELGEPAPSPPLLGEIMLALHRLLIPVQLLGLYMGSDQMPLIKWDCKAFYHRVTFVPHTETVSYILTGSAILVVF